MTNHEPGGRSTSPATPPIRISGTDQMLAALPHMLGYRPARSLVVMATELDHTTAEGVHRSCLAYTLRVDLPPPQGLPQLPAALAAPLTQTVAGASGQVMLHAFVLDPPGEQDDGADLDPDEPYLAGMVEALHRLALGVGAVLHDVTLVHEGRRVRRAVCATRRTQEGWRDAPAAADVAMTADLVLRGKSPLPSREAVTELVRRRDEQASAAADLALDLLAKDPSRFDEDECVSALGAWVVHGQPEPSARQRAWIAVLLDDTASRDAVLSRWVPELFELDDTLPPEEVERFRALVPAWPEEETWPLLERMLRLCARTPRHLTPPLLTLTALVAWCRGEGTIANEACALALEIDPGYRMAQMLDHALARGLRPPTPDRRSRRERRRRPAA